jgi:hypothetical protein
VASSGSNVWIRTKSLRLFPKVQLLDQILVPISLGFAQVIKQTPALRDHLE